VIENLVEFWAADQRAAFYGVIGGEEIGDEAVIPVRL
jgi:hypothetical protein